MKASSAFKPLLFTLLFLDFFCVYICPDTDTLVSRCKQALRMDVTSDSSRNLVISLLDEIKREEDHYLKSALYPDVRSYYEKLLIKIGEYYLNEEDLNRALDCYVEADKYSVNGWKTQISLCKTKIAEQRMIKNYIRIGTTYYIEEQYDEAEDAFDRVLIITPNNSKAQEYLKKINEWKKIPVIDPKTYAQFKKNHKNALILPELKRKFDKKYSNLPPEMYFEYLKEVNNKGYWEAEFDGHIMVFIPQKSYGMGGFFVDKYEVSFAQLEKIKGFEDKRRKLNESLRDEPLYPYHPAVVSFKEAQKYCKKKGFRLLTEQEWELIAGKNRGYRYPWGNLEVDAFGDYRANYDDSMSYRDGFKWLAPVTGFKNYASPYGILNLVGNVWEWVQDKKCKGGGFMSQKQDLEITSSSKNETWVGFRCAKDVKDEQD